MADEKNVNENMTLYSKFFFNSINFDKNFELKIFTIERILDILSSNGSKTNNYSLDAKMMLSKKKQVSSILKISDKKKQRNFRSLMKFFDEDFVLKIFSNCIDVVERQFFSAYVTDKKNVVFGVMSIAYLMDIINDNANISIEIKKNIIFLIKFLIIEKMDNTKKNKYSLEEISIGNTDNNINIKIKTLRNVFTIDTTKDMVKFSMFRHSDDGFSLLGEPLEFNDINTVNFDIFLRMIMGNIEDVR